MLERILNDLRVNHAAYFGSALPPQIEVRSTTPHPNSRIACLGVRWGHEERVLFVKLLYPDRIDERSNRSDRRYKEGQINTEYRVLTLLHRIFEATPDLGVVKPVALFPHDLALVTEGQPGVKFSSLLGRAKVYSGRDQLGRLLRLSYLAGRWLDRFQRALPEPAGSFTFQEVLEYCDVRLDILVRSHPAQFTAGFCDTLRGRLIDQIDRAGRGRVDIVGRHNDFSAGNIIVSGSKLVLLDFSGFSYGPSCSDYVKFWSGLDLMRGGLLVPANTVEALQDAFRRGYGRHVDPTGPLFTVFRLAYVLDKMGDLWRDWPRLPWFKRPAYAHLYRRYAAWINAIGSASAREHSYA